MGGTGKSILVEYLILHLKDKYKLATLSRGYGRSSKGFIIAEKNSLPSEVGDEPFQFLNNHPEIKVTVSENRIIKIMYFDKEKEKYDTDHNLWLKFSLTASTLLILIDRKSVV